MGHKRMAATRLETRKMEYLHRLRSTVTTVAAQVSNALPGNPVTRDYEVLSQIASAGPGLSWKIYAGRKRSTKQAVAVWLFEKKDLDRWPRQEREMFTEVLKKGVSQLTRLRHPRILVIEHPLEESRDSFAFCTEPIFASVANCLGRHDNMAPSIPAHIVDFEFLDVEIRHGLFQLTEALSFLHIDARMLHGNLCPDSVIVNEKGAWKLAAFDFSIQATPSSSGQCQYEMLEWNERTMSLVQPSMDYLAPEYILGGRCDTYADIYSLGVLAVAVFNHCRPPFDNRNSLKTFKDNAYKLKSLPNSVLVNLPTELRDDVKMCLNFTPDLRPDANQFSKIVYFDNAQTKALNYFDSLCQMDNAQKMQFFKTLPNVLGNFPKRPLLQKVLPYLSAEFTTADLIPFILPSIFLIAEQSTDSEFASVILPQLIPVFAMDRPYQIVLMLLQKMELLLKKTPEEDMRRHVLPLVYNAISNDIIKIQELCLSIIPNVGKLVDRDSMKTQLLPKLLRLVMEGNVLSVRVQALICLGKLLPTLEPWMVHEQILPALPKVNIKEAGVLMAVLGIYKLALDNPRFGISREQCAKSVLPFLIATSVENTLNLQQFEQFMLIIHVMLQKVESEQRSRLQQLSASQEDQRNIPDFNQVLSHGDPNKNPSQNVDSLSDLVNGGSGPTPSTVRVPPAKTNTLLSLEEKKRLAAEQEQNIRMRQQPSLVNPAIEQESAPKTTSMAQRSEAAPFDLFGAPMTGSILAPSTSSSSQVTPKPSAIDLTEFLQPSMNKPVMNMGGAPMSALSNPSAFNSPMLPPAFGTMPTIQQQFGGNLNFGTSPTVNALPQPPQSQNPVQRSAVGPYGLSLSPMNAPHGQQSSSNSKPDLSAFDSLVTFNKPAKNTSGGPSLTGAMHSAFIRPPPINTAFEQKSKAISQQIDPFADLLR